MARDIYVLITHERSGIVREAFNAFHGIRAFSCDIEPAEDGRDDFHIRGDAVAAMRSRRWDFIGMHPECTYINGAGLHWNNRGRGWEKTEAAVQHVHDCVAAAGETPYYLENPVGILSTRWRKPDQTIQPYEFKADASKRTCLWLQGLPILKKDPAQRVKGRMVEWPRGSGKMVERWSNQTDSGQNRLAPGEARAMDRARTYPGIAAAMAEQWVLHLLRTVDSLVGRT